MLFVLVSVLLVIRILSSRTGHMAVFLPTAPECSVEGLCESLKLVGGPYRS